MEISSTYKLVDHMIYFPALFSIPPCTQTQAVLHHATISARVYRISYQTTCFIKWDLALCFSNPLHICVGALFVFRPLTAVAKKTLRYILQSRLLGEMGRDLAPTAIYCDISFNVIFPCDLSKFKSYTATNGLQSARFSAN